jgi:hypothetical protein
VVWWLGPQQAWKGAHRLPVTDDLGALLDGKHVRLGAFGDPSAVPLSAWDHVLERAAGWTGYTHFWGRCDPRYARFLIASVDSEDEKADASARGWRTFRVRTADDELHDNEVVCPASAEAGHATTCLECQLCRGTERPAKSVAIYAHGQRIKWLGTTRPS